MLASDIDRTLLWSRKRIGEDVDRAGLVCLEVLKGKEHAFVTQRAWTAIDALAATGELVLVTTRTPEQVLRLKLPPFRQVLCLNGGVLLVEGEPDADHARATDELIAQRSPLDDFTERVQHLVGAPHVKGLRDADGHFGYFKLTGGPVPDGWAEELDSIAAADGWRTVHEQTKVYAMPDTLTKEAGLARILERHGGELVAAAGDSKLDEGMLRLANHALVPHDAYLTTHGWDGDVTEASGVMAGEEIALWLEQHSPGGEG